MFKQKISYLISEMRLKDDKFTKASLCESIDLTPVGLDAITSGKSNPKISNLEKDCQLF